MKLTGDNTGKDLSPDDEKAGGGASGTGSEGPGDGREAQSDAEAGGARGGGGVCDDEGAAKADSGRRRTKKKKGRDLAELLSRKNEMLQELENRLGEMEQLNAKLEDRLLRLAAEFENFRKRTRREWELHEKIAAAGLIRDLLGTLDDFDRALAASGEARGDNFKDGVALIYASFVDVLRRNGLREIEALGTGFDPQVHEAVGQIETTEVEAGCIAEVVQKGYMFHDQVLRAARVIVARGTS